MKQKGLNPSSLEEKSGVSKSSIYNYISGKYKPNEESCKKLAKVLGVSLLDLESKRLYPIEYEAAYHQSKKKFIVQEPEVSYTKAPISQTSPIRNLEKLENLLREETSPNKEEILYLLQLLKFSFQKELSQSHFQSQQIELLLQEISRLKNREGL